MDNRYRRHACGRLRALGLEGEVPPLVPGEWHDQSVNDFFPEPPPPADHDDEPAPIAWLNPPGDVLPGIVPVELLLGRSDLAAVMLTGLRAFPTGVAMTMHVHTRGRLPRFSLHDELFDGPFDHNQDEAWQRDRLKWGFEYADGRRATNLGPWPDLGSTDQPPDHPVLMGGGGGGDGHTADRDYWLWPLPPAGPLMVVCEWLQLGIERTSSRLEGAAVVAAAARARAVWPADG